MNQLQDKPSARADLAAAERVLATFGHSERIESLLVERLEGLIEAIPRLHAWRGFSDGAWVIGARTAARGADEGRTTRADYSRIDFEIRIDGPASPGSPGSPGSHGSPAGRVEVVCRSTIRSRDRRSELVALPLDASGLAQLAAWFETMLLSFGQLYFEPAAVG